MLESPMRYSKFLRNKGYGHNISMVVKIEKPFKRKWTNSEVKWGL